MKDRVNWNAAVHGIKELGTTERLNSTETHFGNLHRMFNTLVFFYQGLTYKITHFFKYVKRHDPSRHKDNSSLILKDLNHLI